MQALLDDKDYQSIATRVLEIIKQDYDLVPKQSKETLIGLEQFRHQYGHNKSPAWLKLYLLPKMPGVFGLNAGKGHPVKIDEEKATRWLTKHENEIDWDKPLPR